MKRNISGFILLLIVLTMGCTKEELLDFPVLTQGEWKIVRTADNNNYFSSLSFSDKMNGWAVGNSGKILHTSDGGNSWNIQESGTTTSLNCVYFVNSQKGWIGAANNYIGITTNGGNSWSWQQPAGESRRTFMSMSFVNENTGWIVDNFGGILHTKDGGQTWTSQISGTSWAITSVQFFDAQEGWATATNWIILHTTNGGNKWTTKTLDNLRYGGKGGVGIFEDIFFYNRSKGWIATNSTSSSLGNPVAPIVSTSDAGISWICSPSQSEWITSLQFVSENSGWAAGMTGILHTTDGGINWVYQFEESSDTFVGLCFTDQSHGWAITFTGNIYKYQIP